MGPPTIPVRFSRWPGRPAGGLHSAAWLREGECR